MEEVISISHATDIDGVGGSSLIRMKYGIPQDRVFFTDYNVESIRMVEKGIKRLLTNKTTVFLIDLGVNERTGPAFLSMLRNVKRKGGKVLWFDHHPWTGKSVRELESICDTAIYGENRRYCGAEITRRELGLRDGFTERLCRLVHYSDFNIRPRKANDYRIIGTYALSIAYYHTLGHERSMRGLRHMTSVISNGRLLDERIRSDAGRFRRLNDGQVARMLRDVYLGRNIALGFAGHIQKTYACMKLIEKTGRDIGVYVNLIDHRGHMRSVRSDCSQLAVRFGGGGHPHASGFSPDFRKYNNFRSRLDRERLLEDLVKTADRINLKPARGHQGSSSKEALFN